jgi:hypothetical protein
MAGLHNQLKQTVKERQDLDNKAVNSASHAVFLEQMKAIEEEQSFVRKRYLLSSRCEQLDRLVLAF